MPVQNVAAYFDFHRHPRKAARTSDFWIEEDLEGDVRTVAVERRKEETLEARLVGGYDACENQRRGVASGIG